MKTFLSAFLMTLMIGFAQGQIIINEISYNPCGMQGFDNNCEFMEIYNAGETAVDLSGWSTDDPAFTFPAGTTIAAGEYILMTVNDSFSGCTWTNPAPAGVQMYVWTGGNLGNTGESVVLSDAAGTLQDIFTYSDTDCGADGNCYSLQYNGVGDNSDCTSWEFQVPTPGAENISGDLCELDLFPGDPCDDGDPNTINDVFVFATCTCEGVIPDCPDLPANIGDECDDGDPNTVNDVILEDCTCEGIIPIDMCPGVFISEFAYDCGDADMNEVIELAVPNDFTGSLADIIVELYNGNGNGTYATLMADAFTAGNNDGTYTYYILTGTSIQNGAPDGIALSYQGRVCEFLSYEGVMTAENGMAQGVTSTDVGVTQTNGTPCDETIQLVGDMWVNACATPGDVNTALDCSQVFDCETEMLDFGDPCDDSDPATIDDVIQEDCTCAGTVPDCPDLMLNFDDACDDNDPTTVDDIIQADCTCAGTMPGSGCSGIFINEFAYDCDEGDANEVIEIAVPNTFMDNVADVRIDLYNGSNGTSYNDVTLDQFTIGVDDGTYVYYFITGITIQNGAPDGIALSFQGTVCQFISYEGTITATDGPALGMTSTNVGVSQNNNTTCDETIQLFDGTWVNACASPGDVNTNLLCDVNFDCMDEMTNFGDECDDGDATTVGDVIQTDCTCAGTPPDCPDLMLNFGTPCDDGNDETVLDVIQMDCTCAGIIPGDCPGAFINEFAYDCVGTPVDANESLEVCVPNSFTGNLADIQIDLYNGNGGAVYHTFALDTFTQGSNNGVNTYYSWQGDGTLLQNGADGLALSYQGTVCEFISYEGAIMATDGIAAGMTSMNIESSQSNATECDQTLQLYNCVWINACATLGNLNTDQNCMEIFDCPDILANFGDNCNDGNSNTEDDMIMADCTCVGDTIPFDCPELNAYFGDFCDDGDPMTQLDEVQPDCTCEGIPFQCPDITANYGEPCDDGDPATTTDMVLTDCTCGGYPAPNCPGAFISEFAYNCQGVDTNEVIEVTIPDSFTGNLADIQIDLYNGLNGLSYFDITLDNFTLGVQANGVSIYSFAFSPGTVQNGPDGFALSYQGALCEFYSYGRVFGLPARITALDGPALGFSGINIVAQQSNDTQCDQSLQLLEDINVWISACATPGNFNSTDPCPVTYDCPELMVNFGTPCNDGNINTTNDVIQMDCACAGTLMTANCFGAFISEFAYDCNDNDANELIEITVPNAFPGTLANLAINLYDSNGMLYNTTSLSDFTIRVNDGVYTYYTLTGTSINDGIGGMSLSLNGANCELISYGGAFTAVDGPAQDFNSTNIGLVQGDTTSCDASLQLFDCGWLSACSTAGNVNNNIFDCSIAFDCPLLQLNVGDSCDDGNPLTMMDTVQLDCNCVGDFGCMTGDIIITEINYNPCSDIGSDSGYEFIEIYNNGATDVFLEDWEMDADNGAFGSTAYTFPAIIIPPGGYLVIARNASNYEGTMGLTTGVNLLDWDASLGNSSGEIVLYDCDGNLVDEVFYDDNGIDSGGFPECADGDNDFCATLALPTSNYTADNNINTNWQVQINGGSPGAANSTMTCDGMIPCSIIIDNEEISICDDNGTPDDMTDDTFTITVTATVENGSGSYIVNDGTNTSASTASGASVVLGPYSADGVATVSLTYSDASDAICSFTTAPLGPIEACSTPVPCSITIDSEVVSTCNNNGTPTDPADDTFTITVTATVANGSGSYTVNDGTNTSAPTTSGTSVIMGPYPADGSTTVNLTYSDASDTTCTNNSPTLGPVNLCSAPACENTFIQNFPANNGQ